MNRLSRIVMIAAFVVGLPASGRSAEVDALLPPETEQIVFMNVKQILGSDIIKKFALGQIKQTLEGNDAQKFLKEIGLDPLKDIDTVNVGVWGQDKENMNTLAVVRGTFDAEKLFTAAEKASKENADKVSIVEEGDYKLVKFVNKDGKPGYAAVADNKTVLIGSEKKIVATGLTAAIKKVKPTLSKDLAALLLKQDDKASMFMCGVTEGKLKDIPDINVPVPGVDGEKIKDGLQKMNSLAMTINLGKEIALDIVMGMKDADAADDFGATMGKLTDTVKTFLPLLGMQQPNAGDLIKNISDTLKTKVKEKDISLTVKITADAIGKATGKSNE
jgi:hypothetical protein